MVELAVVICTYNPRQDYFVRVLEALKLQTLKRDQWELILVDNNSSTDLTLIYNLAWHPNGRIVKESVQGLTPARCRGIIESAAPLICFVDDDNVLRNDYLQEALLIASRHSFIGAFSGNSIPEYEGNELPVSKVNLEPLLAIRRVDRDWWSNDYFSGCKPIGAGMVIRRCIALRYVDLLSHHPERMNMDRSGKSLMSGGDSDMAMVAIDEGYGFGLFSDLYLTHLIPHVRITILYLKELSYSITFSGLLLSYFRFGSIPVIKRPWIYNYKLVNFYRRLCFSSLDRVILESRDRATRDFLDQNT
jgi:glycosyltransferase involved in cell wall biosynthesis